MASTTHASLECIGSVLRGKWRLDRLLGVGGTATVYAATHRNGSRGAVKVLHPVFCQDPAMCERFLREGWAANQLNHPGVVRVLDDDVTETGSVFLVMELLSGHTLAEYAEARGGRLPIDEVLVYAAAVLDVLEAAHAGGIVHRDIKPENVFLTTDQRVRVLDFGLACMLDADTDVIVTRSGVAMGTPTFMAPEQARGRRDLVDVRTDVYSVGATMFTLLTEEFVQGSDFETVAELVAVTITRQARSLAAVMPDAPTPLIALVDRAVRLNKADRWSSAAEMRAEVERTYEAIFGRPMPRQCEPQSIPSVEVAVATAPHTVSALRRGAWRLAVGVAAVGLAIFAGQAWPAPGGRTPHATTASAREVPRREPTRPAQTSPAPPPIAPPRPPPATFTSSLSSLPSTPRPRAAGVVTRPSATVDRPKDRPKDPPSPTTGDIRSSIYDRRY